MYDAVQKRRILIVEDEPAIQRVLSFFLAYHDFEVFTASNGLQAIQLIPICKPHLIILDLIMQPGTGWDVLHWLRVHQLATPIPVLIVSALVQLSEQLHGFEEGAIEYMTKPAQPSLIVERVTALLALDGQQRAMLHHKRIDEQRQTLNRLMAARIDELTY